MKKSTTTIGAMCHELANLASVPVTLSPTGWRAAHGMTVEVGAILARPATDAAIAYGDSQRHHGATAHTFRHTYLTILARTGIDVKTPQAIAGHSDIQITMNKYVHRQTDKISDAGLAFENKVFA